MCKSYWFIAAAILVLAGIVGWASTPSTHARVVNAPAIAVQIDTLQLMRHAKNLPVEEFEDYSLIFH